MTVRHIGMFLRRVVIEDGNTSDTSSAYRILPARSVRRWRLPLL